MRCVANNKHRPPRRHGQKKKAQSRPVSRDRMRQCSFPSAARKQAPSPPLGPTGAPAAVRSKYYLHPRVGQQEDLLQARIEAVAVAALFDLLFRQGHITRIKEKETKWEIRRYFHRIGESPKGGCRPSGHTSFSVKDPQKKTKLETNWAENKGP